MQAAVIECDECTTESEDFVCTTCGQTGEQIADARWNANLWAAMEPESSNRN